MAKSIRPYLSVIVIGVLYVALSVGAVSTLVFHWQPPLTTNVVSNGTPTVSITLYAGEISDGKMGFGTSPSNLTSPGPTLRLKTSDLVSVTVVNSGKMPHAFAVTDMPRTGGNVLFKATAGLADNPIAPGQQATVIFNPNMAGSTFYYICPISGHAEAGMWGSVIITK